MAFWNGSSWVIVPAGDYGQSLVFCNGTPTWGGCLALISTDTVFLNTTIDSATCTGNVTSDGGTAVVARGICWDTIPSPGISDDHSVNGSGLGVFTNSITGLVANKTYYVRAYATNSRGTAYGTEKSFLTGSPSPNMTSH